MRQTIILSLFVLSLFSLLYFYYFGIKTIFIIIVCCMTSFGTVFTLEISLNEQGKIKSYPRWTRKKIKAWTNERSTPSKQTGQDEACLIDLREKRSFFFILLFPLRYPRPKGDWRWLKGAFEGDRFYPQTKGSCTYNYYYLRGCGRRCFS